MSRNFELMTQLERDSRTSDLEQSATANRRVPMRIAPVPSGSDSGAQEMLRLIQRIFLSIDGKGPRQVVLCGVDDEYGSISVGARAARILAANSARPVCIVDANTRSSGLLASFGLDSAALPSGNSKSIDEQCIEIAHNLWLAGPQILAEEGRVLLPPDQLKERFAQLRETFRIYAHCRPGCRDVWRRSAVRCRVADAAILVVEANKTRRLPARKAKEALEAAGVHVLGTVLHNRSFPIPERVYRRL